MYWLYLPSASLSPEGLWLLEWFLGQGMCLCLYVCMFVVPSHSDDRIVGYVQEKNHFCVYTVKEETHN